MRIPFSILVLGCCALLLSGCPEKRGDGDAPPPPPTAAPAPAPAPPAGAPAPVMAPARLSPADAGAADAGMADAGVARRAGIEGPLEKFRGFSQDESEFAFAVYSEGAGFHLLNVVSGDSGKVKQRFQLSDEANVARARAYLESKGYSSHLGGAPDAAASVKDGKVVISSGGAERYRGDPFGAQGGMGAPQSAEVAGKSPSGQKLAVKVEQVPVTEFGGITTYLIVPAGGGR